MHSNKEKEEIDEKKIKAVLDEKIFSRSYLHAIYILFVNICKENDYKLIPSILYDLFRQLSKMANVKYEEYKIGIFHLQIDIDKDGTVNFEDFLKFITTILKFTYNEIYYKKGINLLPSLSLSVDRKLFIDIVSNLFSSIGNYLGDNSNDNKNNSNINSNLNPFTYYDLSLKFLPFYKFYCTYKNEIKMQSYYNSQKKINEFIQMLINYTNAGYISELQNLLNSHNTNDYYKGLSIFKKSIKPLNYINNELLIIMYNKNIFLFVTIIIKTNLLNKVVMIFNLINNKNNNEQNSNMISPEVIYTFLVILRRILNLYVFVNEIFANSPESDRKCLDHYIKDKNLDYKEFTDYINSKILSPLSNNYDYFYQIFNLSSKKSPSVEAKIKYVMCQLILLTSRIKYEYYKYFITNTNYLEWLTYDIKENINTKNKNNINKINNINIISNINSIDDEKNYIDYISIENVVYNCINIIDITLKYENKIINDNNNKILFIKNLYLKLLLMINNMQELIFDNNNNYSLLNNNKILNNNNIINDEHIPLKSKYICLLGLLNSLNINESNNNIMGESQKIKEFENAKFILQIYNEDFNSKYEELTLPFCFYLKSLIINNKQILSIIAGLDIINNFYNYYSANASNNYCSFSSFLDFCEVILDYTEPKTLINNSNIITAIISIIKKMISDNPSNNKLIADMGIKNKLIELLSKITDLNNANINEEILNVSSIFNTIIYYMVNNFYYIEEMSYLNKKGIVFNILLIENGLNVINNIFSTNLNSYEKILKHFTPQNLEILANLFDKIALLWDIDDKNNINLSEEIIKNKYVFDKYKDLPKKNVLIQILSIFDNLLNYKDKNQFQNNSYKQIFNYINEIDINIRIKLGELRIGDEALPTLTIYTQTEKEMREEEKSEFTMEIDGLSFYSFKNAIKDGYQSDLEIFYQIESNNGIVKREIKDEKDFEVFIQEILEAYKSQPNKDNVISANLQIKLKEKKVKVKKKCLNCGKEMEVELDIDEEKFEELKTIKNLDSVNNLNKLLDESKNFCENCEKYILEHITNQITIENSKNRINNLSGINLTNLNLSEIPGNNTYQNIVVNDTLRNELIKNNILSNSLLSNSLFNRTITPGIGLNNLSNINNQNNTLFGLNGINNISAISPMTPRRDNTMIGNNNFNNGLTSNVQNYRILQTKFFQ